MTNNDDIRDEVARARIRDAFAHADSLRTFEARIRAEERAACRMRINQKFTDRQITEAMRRWKLNESTETIAADLGCSRRSVDIWAKERGFSRAKLPPRRHYEPSVIARAVKLYVGGRSAAWVAAVVSPLCHHTTILNWVRAAGELVRPDTPRILDEEHVAALKREHGSPTKVAKILGCSKSGVISALRRYLRIHAGESSTFIPSRSFTPRDTHESDAA